MKRRRSKKKGPVNGPVKRYYATFEQGFAAQARKEQERLDMHERIAKRLRSP